MDNEWKLGDDLELSHNRDLPRMGISYNFIYARTFDI